MVLGGAGSAGAAVRGPQRESGRWGAAEATPHRSSAASELATYQLLLAAGQPPLAVVLVTPLLDETQKTVPVMLVA